MSCHCGSAVGFDDCCEKFIFRFEKPKTAEQLMRSRFTAYKLNQYQYLIETCQSTSTLTVDDFDAKLKWLGLKIISTRLGQISDKLGTVEFVAYYQRLGIENINKFEQLHEKSYFEKIDFQWVYINGDPLPNVNSSRNEPCFCNSGKKHKKCHGV